MPNPLRGLYAVTHDDTDTRHLLGQVAALAAGGGRWLQYRNKTAPQALRQQQAAQVAEVCRQHRIGLIINDDLELALAIGADGVHLGESDGDLHGARQRLGPGRLLGASCYNDLARVDRAVAAGADYVAIGAVFSSATKPGARHAPLALLRQAKARASVPVVAIGGITLANAPQVIAAGADMIAVVSDLFGAPDIAGRARDYQQLFA